MKLSDNIPENMNIETFLDSLILLKTVLLLVTINVVTIILTGISPLTHIDVYIQIVGHCLIIVTALISIFLNYGKIKTRIKELRKNKHGKSKPNS